VVASGVLIESVGLLQPERLRLGAGGVSHGETAGVGRRQRDGERLAGGGRVSGPGIGRRRAEERALQGLASDQWIRPVATSTVWGCGMGPVAALRVAISTASNPITIIQRRVVIRESRIAGPPGFRAPPSRASRQLFADWRCLLQQPPKPHTDRRVTQRRRTVFCSCKWVGRRRIRCRAGRPIRHVVAGIHAPQAWFRRGRACLVPSGRSVTRRTEVPQPCSPGHRAGSRCRTSAEVRHRAMRLLAQRYHFVAGASRHGEEGLNHRGTETPRRK
jgi:hypothetical protein